MLTEFQDIEYGEVELADPMLVVPSNLNWMEATPTLSVELAVSVVVPTTNAPSEGDERTITGAILSAAKAIEVVAPLRGSVRMRLPVAWPAPKTIDA